MTARLPALALLLAVAAVWLALDNPSYDGASGSAQRTCAAPYDTVLGDASGAPGGEPRGDTDEVAERCRELGEERFAQAALLGLAAVLVGTLGWAAARRRRSGPAPTAE